MRKMRTRKKMRMKKRKRRKKISDSLILDFFAVPNCIFFLYRMVIFLYLFLLFVACINEWAKPFYSPLICLCGFAMLCVVSPKLKKCFVVPISASLFCRFILFAMNFNSDLFVFQ